MKKIQGTPKLLSHENERNTNKWKEKQKGPIIQSKGVCAIFSEKGQNI